MGVKPVVACLSIIMSTLQLTYSFNALILMPACSPSHTHVFGPVARELIKRGHQVTMFSSCKSEDSEGSGVTHVHHDEGSRILQKPHLNFFQSSMNNVSFMSERMKMIMELSQSFYEHPFVQALIREPMDPVTKTPKFHVVVIDMNFNDFCLPIANHLGVPNILLYPSIMLVIHAWHLDIPFPYSYVPIGTAEYSQPMTFVDRAINAFWSTLFVVLYGLWSIPDTDRLVRRFLPNSPSTQDLFRNVSFVITNSHVSVNPSVPTMPYYVELGGLHCRPAKPLPQELETWMQHSEGVIYFSLGTYTKGEAMPEEMKDKVIEAFSQLPQKVLWKFEQDIPHLPNNVRLTKWAPQQDLLAHPQLRLFISHGGGLSTAEAAYHGCPVLGFPLSGDQSGNMVQAKKAGFAEYLNWRTFTAQQLLHLINKMLNDQRYKERALFASVLMRDRAEPPVKTAAYWIEYVVRHRGAPFLKTTHLNTFQYFLIDIMAVIAVILLIAGIISLLIFKYFCKYFCTHQTTRVKLTAINPNKQKLKKKKQKHF